MNKPLSLALVVTGVVLLFFGLNAGNSFLSDAKEALTGTPTDRSLILIVTGIVAIAIGGSSSAFRRHN